MNAKMRTRTLWLLTMIWGSTLTGDVSTEVREKRQTDTKYIDDRKVVCYYANWAVYRQGDAKFTPQNINPYLCTHLIYASEGVDEMGAEVGVDVLGSELGVPLPVDRPVGVVTHNLSVIDVFCPCLSLFS